MGSGKKFLIVGNLNAATAKDVFPLIQREQVWMGVSRGAMTFNRPDGSQKSLGNALWYTNLDHKRRHELPKLVQRYQADEYPRYDNFDAIEVPKLALIPYDYEGAMGVPITYLTQAQPGAVRDRRVVQVPAVGRVQRSVLRQPAQALCPRRHSEEGPGMKTWELKVSVEELVMSYEDNGHGGVRGLDGRLDIRPPYQREFVYTGAQAWRCEAVALSVRQGWPLGQMYWVARDGNFEVLDGQQRTISLAQYVDDVFACVAPGGEPLYFCNLTEEEQAAFLAYPLNVVVCEGDERAILDWFRVVNTQGLVLKPQEMRNAVYAGAWLADAKAYFSTPSGQASALGRKYVDGAVDRQEVLEEAIAWACGSRKHEDICGYMAEHQGNRDAKALWRHFEDVTDWVKVVFPVYRKEMRGIEWGRLHAEHGDVNASQEAQVALLMADEDVGRKRGNLRVRAVRRGAAPAHPHVLRQAAARGVRAPGRAVCPVRLAHAHRGDGGRSHRALEPGGPDGVQQLPDAA